MQSDLCTIVYLLMASPIATFSSAMLTSLERDLQKLLRQPQVCVPCEYPAGGLVPGEYPARPGEYPAGVLVPCEYPMCPSEYPASTL